MVTNINLKNVPEYQLQQMELRVKNMIMKSLIRLISGQKKSKSRTKIKVTITVLIISNFL